MKIYVLMLLIGAIVASSKVYRQNLFKAELAASLRTIRARCLHFRRDPHPIALSNLSEIERRAIPEHRFGRWRWPA